MGKTTVFEVKVAFGDCDPAGIVFFHNYLKWMDAASLHFFKMCGVPRWAELEQQTGILGDPWGVEVRLTSGASKGKTLTARRPSPSI